MSVRNVLMRWFIMRPTQVAYLIFRPKSRLLRFIIDVVSMPARLPPFGVRREKSEIGGVEGTKFTPKKNLNDSHILVFLHGGGYSFGSSRTTHRALISNLAKKLGIVAYGVDYRRTPENPFPAAFEDAEAAWDEIIEKHPTKKIILAGDSAGGGLCLALMIQLKQKEKQLPNSCLLLSPWTDLSLSGNSMATHKKRDPYLTRQILQMYSDLYCKDVETTDWRVSPLFGDFSGLPPTLVMVGDREILLDDARRMKEPAEKGSMDLQIEVWPEMIHVWMAFGAFIPEGKKAFIRIDEWFQSMKG